MNEYHPVVYKIIALLDAAGIPYQTFEHDEVRTSEEAAAVRPEFTLAQGAKALLVRVKSKGADGGEVREFVQVVIPGDQKFDSKKLRAAIGARDLRFASEAEVSEITGGIKPGGVPPFGNLFGLKVVVERSLLDNDEIIFNAGDRRFSIAIRSEDFIAIVKPTVVSIV